MGSKIRIVAEIGLLISASVVVAHAAPPGDACSLLNAAQVSAALGSAVSDGQAVGRKLCMWKATATAKNGSTPRVALTIGDAQKFAYAKMPLPDAKITKAPLSGVGDEAVYGTTAGQLASINVKKGSSYFAISVNGVSMDKTQALVTQLAKEALAKL